MLAVALRAVERHMGRISAQSIPGEGTTFTIVLPLTGEEIDGAVTDV